MLYFAYGSNLNKLQMKKRCQDSVPIIRAKLKGYKLIFNRHADVVECENGIVYGAIYEVSGNDIKHLDKYEGFPRYYTRKDITVEDDDGKNYECFVYVMTKTGTLLPDKLYYDVIKQGYKD